MSSISYNFVKERVKKGLERFRFRQIIIPANDYQLGNEQYFTNRFDIVFENSDGKRHFVGTNLVKYSRGDQKFDYCLTDFEWNDSAFLYQAQAIHRLFKKMYCLESYCAPKMPKDWLATPYEFTYTYGDIIDFSHQDLENSPDAHCCPWHQILVMPVHFDVKKIGDA